jgi:hypothetical protein
MNKTTENSDHRTSPRYRCRCYATVLSTNLTWDAHLLNLSQNGALIGVIIEHNIQADDKIELLIELGQNDVLNLKGHVAHVKDHYIGIECAPLTESDYARHISKLEELGQETNGATVS